MVVKVMEETSKCGHTYWQWIMTILVNTTLLTYGMQSAWVSPVIKTLQSETSPTGPLTDNDISWVVSTMSLAACSAVPLYAYIADRFGRKVAVICVAALQALGWAIKLVSTNVATLIVSQVFAGLAAGGCFNIVPIYVKEISQDDIRGLLGSLLILSQNIGLLAIYAMGAYLDYYTVLWTLLGLPVLTVMLTLKAPETPAYLVKVERYDDAAATLAFLRGRTVDDKIVQNEIICLRNEDSYAKSLENVSFMSIWQNLAWRRATLLMLAILSIPALNGCVSIVMYASTIMTSSGVTASPQLQSLSFPAVMILAAFVSMTCVERFGRKITIATAQVFLTISFLCLGVITVLQSQGTALPGWLSVACMVAALASNAAGPLPVAYIMIAEVFNIQIRAKVIGLLVAYAWLGSFCQLMLFTPVSNIIGFHGAFFGYGIFNLLAFFFILVFLPETKGKSVEEIELELSK